jgi:hypothetical protein
MRCLRLAGVAAALLVGAAPARAWQQAPGAGGDAGELAKQLVNPVASLISVPLQLNANGGFGPGDDVQWVLNVQPVIPFSLSQKWNLITRTIVPVIDQPALTPGAGRTFGLGDVSLSLFASPKATEPFIWGLGPIVLVPTATDDPLGAGKLGLGPTLVVLKQAGPWTVGALLNQVWSVAGDSERAAVSQALLQPFLAYATKTGTTLNLNSETTVNWEAASGEKVAAPLQLTVSQVLKAGPQLLSVGLTGGYFVEKPSIGPDWRARLVVTLLFPKKPER